MKWNLRFLTLLFCLFLLPAGCGAGNSGGGSADGAASTASSSAGQDGSEPSGSGSASEEADQAAVLTLAETVTFFQCLSPQILGLEGTSMYDYQVYPAESMVPVDGVFCTKLSVFSTDKESGTNRFRGVYLLTRDQKHLYWLEQRTSKVTELPLPKESTV